jgi:hypothetical protein
MNKPQPAEEATIRQISDHTIRITVHTPDAMSVVNAAREFGMVYEAVMYKNMYDLSVANGFDVSEVLQYLKAQV